jgi:hypothetical protein
VTDEALGCVRTNGSDPRCKSCNHPKHEEYDKDYFNGVITKSEYARRIGCSIPSATRHLEGHVSRGLAVVTDAKAVSEAPIAGDRLTDEALGCVRNPGFDPRCKSCRHPSHEEYDRDYFNGRITKSEYARRVGCSIPSVTRHLESHVPKNLAAATEAQAVANADTLLEDVKGLRKRAIGILETAEEAGDLKTALLGIREARSCMELLAKVEGQLKDTPQINFVLSAEWIELRTLIVTALDPYPEAQEAMVLAIRGR